MQQAENTNDIFFLRLFCTRPFLSCYDLFMRVSACMLLTCWCARVIFRSRVADSVTSLVESPQRNIFVPACVFILAPSQNLATEFISHASLLNSLAFKTPVVCNAKVNAQAQFSQIC